ncbi:MAG TPA: hypothetical protein VFH01_06825 [Pyrinomonadaceae bacterium]|nr:hypothetical protein [Pyrinomonadaceae bacterium]
MDRIPNTNTAYQDDSHTARLSTPRFTRGAARRAQQVVALRPDFLRPVRSLWRSLAAQSYRTKVLAGIVAVAIVGSVVGGLLAAVNNANEDRIEAETLATDSDAGTQFESSQPTFKPTREVHVPASKTETMMRFDGPEVERAVAELKKRQSSSREKKAYRVATIYPDGSGEFGRERKQRKKH